MAKDSTLSRFIERSMLALTGFGQITAESANVVLTVAGGKCLEGAATARNKADDLLIKTRARLNQLDATRPGFEQRSLPSIPLGVEDHDAILDQGPETRDQQTETSGSPAGVSA